MQTTLDLRARFAAAKDNAEKAQDAPAAEPTGPAISPARINLLHTMLTERYPAEEAERRFAQFDWEKMTVPEFRRFFTYLKAQPRIDRPAKKTSKAVEGTMPIVEGKFTVVFDDDTHKTLRVRRQSDEARFMPGMLLVGHLTGPDNDSDYTNIGHVTPSGAVVIWKKHRDNERLTEAIKVLVGDPLAAVKAYARMSQRCGFCDRPLTHPTSLDCLYGERCAEKHGLPWG